MYDTCINLIGFSLIFIYFLKSFWILFEIQDHLLFLFLFFFSFSMKIQYNSPFILVIVPK